jgi:hypothetical protein
VETAAEKSPLFFHLDKGREQAENLGQFVAGYRRTQPSLEKGFHSPGIKMPRKLLQIMALIVCLTPAWGKETLELSFFRQPNTVFDVGPGTVVTVHLLQLPFLEPHYAVKYKTDSGELIEVWTPHMNIVVLEGMYGILTYSTNPERILNFRAVEQKPTR